MYVEKRPSWFATVVLGGFALPHIWIRTLTVTLLSVGVTVLYRTVPAAHISLTATPFTLIGLPLGIFLGFRNNTAYDRFWEGRRLWGSLVNTTRSLARQALTIVDGADSKAPPDEVRAYQVRMVHLVIAYVHAMRLHLRDLDPYDKLAEVLGEADAESLRGHENTPLRVLQRLGEHVRDGRRRDWIHVQHVPIFDQSLTILTDIQGACERIKSTPIPYSYTVLMHRIVAGYCVLLPFGLADSIGRYTPVVVAAVSYCLFGLDSVGEEIEQPFGRDVNDLPLRAISRTIEANLRQALDEPAPPPALPTKGVLS